MEPEKVLAVTNWLELRKQVQRLLAFVNFYQRFVRNYGTIATPLTAVTSSLVPFRWSATGYKVSQALKSRFRGGRLAPLFFMRLTDWQWRPTAAVPRLPRIRWAQRYGSPPGAFLFTWNFPSWHPGSSAPLIS